MHRLLVALLGLALTAAGVGVPQGAVADAAQALPPGAVNVVEAASPDRSLQAEVGLVDGRLTYAVTRDQDTTVVRPSGLGFTLRDPQVDLRTGMSVESVERSTIDETWTPAWGTSAQVRNHANELVLHAQHEATGIRLDVVVRVFDDGVGLRYHFPEQEALGSSFVVTAEATEFSLPPDLTAHFLRSGTDNNADERHYQTALLPEVATAQTPMTLERADGLFVAVHEADLTDYASMTLERDATVPGRMTSELISLPGGDKAVVDLTDGGFSTPWRTLTVGRGAGDLAESHLIENLNDPCAICDVDSDGDGVDDTTDWIEPATYTGVWWELQRRDTTWNAGPDHGATTQRVKDYIDLAADAGAEFVLAEGWNTNAGGSWTNQDFTTPQADFDLPQVLDYADSKGVGFVAHNETRGYVDYYDDNLERIFSTYEDLGIHSIKTGYATRFRLGGVQRSHYDQEAVQHYQRVIDAAAEHGITINAHESIKPTGLARTYPNMMTGEGVAGMEQQNYKGAAGNPPAQASILPFTRYLGGPADYTPGVLDVTWDPADLGTRVQTTTTAQLALYTTFFSPLQMLADTPENYARHPEAYAYLKDVPTTWDESQVEAEIGDHVVTARRSGEQWYVGAITDEQDRTLEVPLSFLAPGTTYVAEIWSDAEETTWKGNPFPVEVTRSLVDADTTMVSSIVAGGGQALRIRPATAQDEASLERYRAPEPTLQGTPTTRYDPRTGTVEVRARIANTGSTVGAALIAIDGERVGDPVRVAAGGERMATFRLPAADLPYPGPSTLAIDNGAGSSSGGTDVELLPVPRQEERAAIQSLIEAGDLDETTGAAALAYLDRADSRVEEGDFVGVRKAMQGLRLLVGSVPLDSASQAAATTVTELTTPYLGDATGVFRLLGAVREVEASGEVSPEDLETLRSQAVGAARTAVTGEEADARAQLEELRTSAARSADAGPRSGELATLTSAMVEQRQLETESGRLEGGASVTTEHPGFTGTGFVKALTRAGAAVTVSADLPTDLDQDVSFRYANGMVVQPLDRQLTLSVAGDPLHKVSFPNLGQDSDRWRRWGETVPVAAPGVAGQNAFTLGWVGDDTGNVNVDHVRLQASLGVLPDAYATDVTAPSIAIDVRPDPAGTWSDQAVEVTLDISDDVDEEPSGSIRIDGGPWSAYDGPVTLEAEGLHVVEARAVDAAGNRSPVVEREIGIDTAAPDLRFTYRSNRRFVGILTSDALSGIATVEYRIGDGAWQDYVDTFTLPKRESLVMARTSDRAGNTVQAELEVDPRGKPRTSRAREVRGPR